MRIINSWTMNYKSLKNVQLSLGDDSYITLIGLNDTGKSTVLRSLELFFREGMSLPQNSETSKINAVSNSPLEKDEFDKLFVELGLPPPEYSNSSVYILVQFEIEKELTTDEIDDLKPSDHLQLVLENKKAGDNIYVLKALEKDSAYYILCNDVFEDEQPLQLWSQSQKAIKEKQSIVGIEDSSIKNKNSKGTLKNIERVLAIYSKMDPEVCWSRYDFKKDRSFFPLFEYLDWNVSIEQLQNLVTTAISTTIDQSLKDVQALVNKSQDKVNKKANDALSEIYEKYSEHLPASITGLSANINMPLAKNTTELFVSKDSSDKHIHIADQGDGIKRQIGLGLIRAIAEESIGEGNKDTQYIWVLDEPETHLYPQAQRELADDLRQLSINKFQIVASTHSTTFIDRAHLRNVYKAELIDNYTQLLTTKDTEDALSTLGVKNSDFLFYDKFLAVEGATEYHLLDHFHYIVYNKPLIDVGARKITLGGESNRVHYKKILEDITGDYRKPDDSIVYLLDKDTGGSGTNIHLVGTITDFEDSIANDIWIKLLKNECGVGITNDSLDDMRSKIEVSKKDTKLHKQLAAYVASSKTRTNYLNSKGEALANDLKKIITNTSQIPQAFKDAFEALH